MHQDNEMLQYFLTILGLIIAIIGLIISEQRKKQWRVTLISLLVIAAILQIIIARYNKQEVQNIRDYSNISKFNAIGKPFVDGPGIRYSTGISGIIEPALTKKNDKVSFKCDDESLKRYEQAIQEYPHFPFSYCGMAECLRIRGDPKWKEYASKAISIFKITTKIDGHDKSHEEAMKQLLRYLND